MLDIFAKRSLIENKKLFIAINALFTFTIVLFTLSVYAICYGLFNYGEYAKNTNLEDFQVQTYEAYNSKEINDLENENDLVLEQRDKYVYKFGEDYELTLFPEFTDSAISKPIITEGFGNLDKGQIVLSQEFAKANNVKLGSTITLDNEDFKVVGLASFPNMMYPVNDGGLFPSNKTIGEAYLSSEDFARIEDPSSYYVGKFNTDLNDKSRSVAYDNIKGYKEFDTYETNILNQPTIPPKQISVSNVINITDKSDNFRLNIISLEYKFLGVIIGGLSLVIGAIAIILTSFIFDSLIKKKRRDIGIIRAEGYYIEEIGEGFVKYFSNGIIFSITLGVIIGGILAFGLEKLFSSFFNILHYKIDPILFIVLLIGIFIIFIVLNIFISKFFKVKINKNILTLISNVDDEVKPKKKNRLINTKFTTSMKLNTILRNKGKTMLLVYGVFFSSLLFIFGSTTIFSFFNMEENIRGDYFSYDYELTHSPTYEATEDGYTVNSTISFYGYINDINNEELDNEDIVKVFGMDDNNEYIDVGIEKLKEDEVVITSSLQKDFGIGVGDEITIANPSNSQEEYKYNVANIIDINYENTIYTKNETIQNDLDLADYYYNGVVGRGELNKELQKDKDATHYSYDELLKGVKDYSAMSAIGIIYIASIAGVISLITLTTISSIIINSKRKQIAIMKVLGYSAKEINKLTFSLYKWVVILVYIISYPLSIILIKSYINLLMGLIPNVNYPLVVEASLFQFFFGLIFIVTLYLISSKLAINKINKIKLSESVNRDE